LAFPQINAMAHLTAKIAPPDRSQPLSGAACGPGFFTSADDSPIFEGYLEPLKTFLDLKTKP
jgi:hypothetical protein